MNFFGFRKMSGKFLEFGEDLTPFPEFLGFSVEFIWISGDFKEFGEDLITKL